MCTTQLDLFDCALPHLGLQSPVTADPPAKLVPLTGHFVGLKDDTTCAKGQVLCGQTQLNPQNCCNQFRPQVLVGGSALTPTPSSS
jgi:hypothetical protein